MILSEWGWDAIHVGDVSLSTAADADILAYAEEQGRVVVTLDADFHALLAVTAAAGPSVVRIRIEGLKGGGLAALLEKVWRQVEDDLVKGAMVTVTERALRIKHLPVE